jgi:cell wall-associated NlpC family hydrolase
MNRRTLKFLLLLTIAMAIILAPSTMSGAVSNTHSAKQNSPKTKTANKSLARKHAALAVLREYLPNYADILEAKTVRFEDIYYRGSSIVPVPAPFDATSPFVNPMLRLELLQTIEDWLGTRYRYGGRSRGGVDCSGFVCQMVEGTLGRRIGNSSSAQSKEFAPIFSVDSLQFGDLMFFTGTRRTAKRIGHVGIYLGNGVFAHSSTSIGVTFNHINDGYYARRFRWGGRFSSAVVADADKSGVYVSP